MVPFLRWKRADSALSVALSADIITPNLTELCLLADADPGLAANREDAGAEGDGAEKGGAGDNGRKIVRGSAGIVETAEKLARHVMQDGPKEVVVTGIRFRDSLDGRDTCRTSHEKHLVYV